MNKELTIKYQEYPDTAPLSDADRLLLEAALRSAKGAYSPYSKFHVGAAVLLADGTTVCGSNQENAAYPSGLCAERTALFAASAQHPDCRDFTALAIVGIDADGRQCEASPCGACRQVMLEYERRQGHPMRILLLTDGGSARLFSSARDLLPFGFDF